MKLFILALFALTVAVSCESENAKTETVKEQKTDNSALYGKYLRPLNYNVNQRYGSKQEYNYEGLSRNYYNGLYDYDVERDYYRYRNDGKSYISRRPSYYDYYRNNLGYSRNVGEKGRLVSYRGEQNVYDNSRYSEGRFRNINGKFRQGYVDVRYRNKGYGGYGNMGLQPEYIGYVVDVYYPKGYYGNVNSKGYYGNGYSRGYYGDGYSRGYYGDGYSRGYYGDRYSNGYYGDLNSRGYYGDGYSKGYYGNRYSNGYYGNVNSQGYYSDGYSKGYYGNMYSNGYYDGVYQKE